jgi:hypothetical protein
MRVGKYLPEIPSSANAIFAPSSEKRLARVALLAGGAENKGARTKPRSHEEKKQNH